MDDVSLISLCSPSLGAHHPPSSPLPSLFGSCLVPYAHSPLTSPPPSGPKGPVPEPEVKGSGEGGGVVMVRERLTRLMSLSLHLRYALTVPYATPSLTFRFRDRKERRNVGRILETRELSAPTRHSSFALHYATAEGPLRG